MGDTRITVVGVGPGGDPSAPADAARSAALVVGAARHLDRLEAGDADRYVLDADLDAAIDAIAAADGPVVVLASGDPGFFGIVRRLAARFGPDRLEVRPAPSSVAAAFAAAGLPWDDAVVVSAHGRDMAVAVNTCLAHPKVAVLTAPGSGPAELAAALLEAGGAPRRLVVCEDLGGADERIRELTLEQAVATDHAGPNVILVLDPHRDPVADRPVTLAPPAQVPDGWALPSGAFDHRDGLITAPALRALLVAHLAPATGRLVWDVGAGSGSVGIECARFGAAVVAVDRDADACERVRRNATAHGVTVRVVQGSAPEALDGLPTPDAAFVGGGGDALPAILAAVTRRARRRLAVTLVTVDRVGTALAALERAGWPAGARLVQTSRLRPLGSGHRLDPATPVFVVTAERP